MFLGASFGLPLPHIKRGKLQIKSPRSEKRRGKELDRLRENTFRISITVLAYLGRYTHRVALSNDRILQVENGKVILSYRDRKDWDRKKILTLDAQEFIRRFLLHVLPDGFMRVRHFGFLANRSKRQALAQCRKLLNLDLALPLGPANRPTPCCSNSLASISRAARVAMREP